jgi:hypothetical protein
MDQPEAQKHRAEDRLSQPPIPCEDCEAALHATGGQTPSFLLVDALTIPLLGCDDHIEKFTRVCNLSTDDTADLLHHRPAGGIRCPGCRLAPHNPHQPLIQIHDGAVTVIACPDHQTTILDRFQAGLQVEQQLTTSLNTP